MFHVKHLLQDIVKYKRETLYLDNYYNIYKEKQEKKGKTICCGYRFHIRK